MYIWVQVRTVDTELGDPVSRDDRPSGGDGAEQTRLSVNWSETEPAAADSAGGLYRAQ